jgi:hypothetical protein
MASPLHVLKNSFAGGEVSPQLWSRTDLAKYPSWCKTLKNFIVHRDGSASNRPGTYYMATAKYDGKTCRLRKFVFATDETYQIEFGDYYCRFYQVMPSIEVIQDDINAIGVWTLSTVYTYERASGTMSVAKNGGLIYRCITTHTASATDEPGVGANWESYWVQQAVYEIPTPYSETDVDNLKFTQSADVLFVAHPDYTTRMLSRYGNTDWRLETYPFVGGPFQLPNTDSSIRIEASAVTGLGITLTASAKAWVTATAYQVGTYVTESGTVYKCIVKHTSGTFSTDYLANNYWVIAPLSVFDSGHAPDATTGNVGALFQLRHYVEAQKVSISATANLQSSSIKCGGTWRVVSHGTWTATLNIQKSTDNGVTWTQVRSFDGKNDFNPNTYGTEDMSGNAEPFLVRLTVTGYSSGTLNADLTSDPFYQSGIVQITSYTSGTVVTGDVVRTIASTDATEDWTEGSWSDYRGWPSVIEFNPQDRLILANTYNEPQTSWMTQTGNYYDFSRSVPLVDSDGITVNLPSREVNGINNLVPLTALLALTSSSEWSIGDPGTVLTPTAVEQRVNGYEGASNVDAVTIGNRAIFVQAMGGVIRDLGYELATYSFTGSDLSILANHLFFGYTIVDMDYQKSPDRIVWCVRSDGALLSMTYLREQEVLAWAQHNTNSGTDSFESVSCVPAGTYDQTWFVVKRGTKRYIERMVERLASTAPENQFFMDCGVTLTSVSPTKTWTGLDHLEGKTIAILADGEVKGQQEVVLGSITLDVAASKINAGLPYTSDMETLNVEANLRDGTAQGRRIKLSQFVLGVYNSRGGWIGPNFTDLYELRDNFVTNYGTAVELFTGEVKDTMGGGMGEGGRFCFRQIDPLPITIRYIAGLVTIGGTTGA